MDPTGATKKVLQEADAWFRAILRKGSDLQPHEKKLFEAVMKWRQQLEKVVIPKYPRVPIEKETLKGMPTVRGRPPILPPKESETRPKVSDNEVPTDPYPKDTTIPSPPDVQDKLVRKTKLPPPLPRPKKKAGPT